MGAIQPTVKLQFFGAFKSQKNTMTQTCAGSPTASRSPLPEGAIYLSPRKSLCPISGFRPRS